MHAHERSALVDWSKFPDLGAVALLTLAFASVARHARATVSAIWLTGWFLIAIHFAAFMLLDSPGYWADLASFIGLAALACAGVLFMWAAVPHRRQQRSSLWMLAVLLSVYTLYFGLLVIGPSASWALTPAALLIGVLPLGILLLSFRQFRHPLRWAVVALNVSLAIFLLIFQSRPGTGPTLAFESVLFVVYLGCAIHFWYTYRRATAGAFITIAGFFAWAGVFVAGPCLMYFFPNLHVENEMWNLPKYVVAVGMIMLLLEDQLEHNKYLALHDELTGLPNRRLFQDRLDSAIERARRTGSHVALLLIDLDNFKQVNDTAGHHAGDELLKHVSNQFTGRVRRSDTVARTGGDEFSVILEEPMTRADAVRVGKTLAKLLEEPVIFDTKELRVGASVGIAVFPDDAADAESLRIAADLRMYAGKSASKENGLEATLPPIKRKAPHSVKREPGLQTAAE
ncbi:MAG TPA: diguanylate cyclase [Terracidiphilus sp.]|jgi:diguanylate cyclase (GGDEF)-like protein